MTKKLFDALVFGYLLTLSLLACAQEDSTKRYEHSLEEVLILSESSKHEELSILCKRIDDPSIKLFCALNKYEYYEDAEEFLNSFPNNKEEIKSIFNVDSKIMHVIEKKNINSDRWLTNSYVSVLSQHLGFLMAKGNKAALTLYLDILEQSDGYYAEELSQGFVDFIHTNPFDVLISWTNIEKHIQKIGFDTTNYMKVYSEIIKRYKNLCSIISDQRLSINCKKVETTLKNLAINNEEK